MKTFRSIRKSLGPPWLTSRGDGELIGYALDLLLDGFIERLRQGLLARFPQQDPSGQTTAPEDALAAIGRSRRIDRGLNETAQRYARRLVRWLDDWRVAGNPFALMQQLAGYTGAGPAFRTVDVHGNWFSIDSNGNPSVNINQGNWNWNSDPGATKRWARFWVIIYPNGLWTKAVSGGQWGNYNGTWGSTATPNDVASIRAIVADWKPAGTKCVNIILAFDNTSFDPTKHQGDAGLPNGTWGKWGTTINGVYQPSRLSSACYWDGT